MLITSFNNRVTFSKSFISIQVVLSSSSADCSDLLSAFLRSSLGYIFHQYNLLSDRIGLTTLWQKEILFYEWIDFLPISSETHFTKKKSARLILSENKIEQKFIGYILSFFCFKSKLQKMKFQIFRTQNFLHFVTKFFF